MKKRFFKNCRKSQIFNQVFIYILTLVVTTLILIFGYRAIMQIQERGCDICLVKLRNDLSNSVESIINDYGSITRKDIQMCCGLNQICFVESIDSFPIPSSTDPIIKDSIKSKTGMNTFLLGEKGVQPFNIGKISTEPNVMCLRGAKMSLKLEGKGNYVQISKWS